MSHIKLLILIITLLLLFMSSSVLAQVPAFPGAEGFGATTVGGRGGTVIKVTNTNDSGPGSLRAAIEASGARIVVFTTGGTISLQSALHITNPYLTIAGQTAPGGGICLKDGSSGQTLRIETHDVIVRCLRIRPGPSSPRDGVWINGGSNIIFDHCSISWGVDENFTASYDAHNITVQWCICSQALRDAGHSKGWHSMGMMFGSYIGDPTEKISCHHNYFAHNLRRNPYIDLDGTLDLVNNVIYNWGGAADWYGHITEAHNGSTNFVGNYVKPGPDSHTGRYLADAGSNKSAITFYVSGNITHHRTSDNDPETDCIDPKDINEITVSDTRLTAPQVTTLSAPNARDWVLTHAGAIMPSRDAVDQLVIQSFHDGTSKVIDHPSEVGGWPMLAAGTAPTDSDGDGMPDAWEDDNGLDKNTDDANGRDLDPDYDNIEVYINSLIPSPITGTLYKLDVDTSGLGSVNPSGGSFVEGQKVELTAIPGRGWIFDHWTGDLSGSQNPDTLLMDSDKNVTAVFINDPNAVYDTLTVHTNGEGTVSVAPEPMRSGMRYLRGTQVTVTAKPGGGWEFEQWSGDYSGTDNPAEITMDSSITMTAEFKHRDSKPFSQDTDADGLISMEAENYHFEVPKGDHHWAIADVPSSKGASGDKMVQVLPNSGTNLAGTEIENSPRMDFDINFVKTGTHYVWIRGWSSDSDDNSVHVGMNGNMISTADKLEFPNTSAWEWSKSTMDGADAEINIPSTGVNTLNIWMREDGTRLDKIVLTANAGYVPSGTGPEEKFTLIKESAINEPEHFYLEQNFPNPFNPETNIKYQITRSGHVELNVLNINGQKVKNLHHGYQSAGRYSVKWDGKDEHGKTVSAGIYLYRLKTDGKIASRKMLLLK